MFHPGISELMVILLIAFLIFGVKKIPEIGGALGQGIKNFQKGVKEAQDSGPQLLPIQRAENISVPADTALSARPTASLAGSDTPQSNQEEVRS